MTIPALKQTFPLGRIELRPDVAGLHNVVVFNTHVRVGQNFHREVLFGGSTLKGRCVFSWLLKCLWGGDRHKIHLDQGVLRKVSEELPGLGCPADRLHVKHHLSRVLVLEEFPAYSRI